MKRSWKTTAAGIGTILAAIGTVLMGLDKPDGLGGLDWAAISAMLLSGVGLLMARDNDKSSEDAGIK